MNKKVDDFYFYNSPRAISRMKNMKYADPSKTPWSPLKKPLSECKVSLISTAGIHLKTDKTFDYDRERREPTWGRSFAS